MGWRCKFVVSALLFVFSAAVHAAQPPAGVQIICTAEPPVATPGTVVDLAVQIELPPGWITYDLEQVPNSVMPTRITLDRSEDFAPLQGYSAQIAQETRDPVFKNRVVRYYSQSPTFHRPILLGQDLKGGTVEVRGRMDFQVLQPSTGKYYVIQQTPFRTTIEIRRDPGGPAEATTNSEAAATQTENSMPDEPLVTGNNEPAKVGAATLTLEPTWTHKPILIEEESEPETRSPPPMEAPEAAIEPELFTAPESDPGKIPQPEKREVELSEPLKPLPKIDRSPTAQTIIVPAPETPVVRQSKERPIRNASAIVVEIKPGELQIPFETTFGSSETLVFDWSTFETGGRSLPVATLVLAVLLGLIAFSMPPLRGDRWQGTGIRLSAVVPMGVVAGLYPLLPPGIVDPLLAGMSISAAGVLFLAPLSLPGVLANAVAFASLAMVFGARGGDPFGPLFGLAGFGLGGVVVLVLQALRSSRLDWLADRAENFNPPGIRLLAAYGLLALAAYFFGRADFADHSSDWLGYRGVLSVWCALAAFLSMQTVLPLRATIARLQEKPERLLMPLAAVTTTLALASHLFAR